MTIALREIPDAALSYGSRRGLRQLRIALTDYLARVRAVVADPERIFISAGAAHGMLILWQTLRQRGARRIGVEDPVWPAVPATIIQAVLADAERSALEGLGRLTSLLTGPIGDPKTDAKELRRLLSIALADLLLASDFDAAAIYQFAAQRMSLELVTAHAPVAAPPRIDRHDVSSPWETLLSKAVAAGTAAAELHVVATYPLGSSDEPHGFLVVLSRDPLATVRRPPATDLFLKASADLIGAALASRLLIAGLEHSNRLLGALGDMTTAMLRPGSGQQDVLDAVAGHLTDASVPEFDFNFATVYLLDERADGTAVVHMAAGAATSSTIIATSETTKGDGHTAHKRVPRWALEEERELAADDVLLYVARTRQAAVVGALAAGVESDRGDVITGSIPESPPGSTCLWSGAMARPWPTLPRA